MALIKTGGGITDIRGTLGGNVFKRDASGLHVTAKQRHVKRPRTPEQQAQNDWYCAIKREEYAGGPPEPEDSEPANPTTALIYQADFVGFIRQRTMLNPTWTIFDWPEQQAGPEWDWVIANWFLLRAPNFQNQLSAMKMLYKLERIGQYTFGMTQSQAETWARDVLLSWTINKTAAYQMAKTLSIYGWGVLTVVVALVVDFFSKHNVSYAFNPGESLLKLGGQYFWSRLVSRPSKKLFDFAIGPSLAVDVFTEFYSPEREGGHSYTISWASLYQSIIPKTLWWDVYSWNDMSVSFRCDGYNIGGGLLRGEPGPESIYYYNVPVGWQFSGDPFAYISNIYR